MDNVMSDTVLDPVCGMPVEKRRAAATAAIGGRTYYFCSLSCERQFRSEASKYTVPEIDEIRP